MNPTEPYVFDFTVSDDRLKTWANVQPTNESLIDVLRDEYEGVTHAYFMMLGSYAYALACSTDPVLQRDPEGKDILGLVNSLRNWRENLKLALEHALD